MAFASVFIFAVDAAAIRIGLMDGHALHVYIPPSDVLADNVRRVGLANLSSPIRKSVKAMATPASCP